MIVDTHWKRVIFRLFVAHQSFSCLEVLCEEVMGLWFSDDHPYPLYGYGYPYEYGGVTVVVVVECQW